MEPQSSGQTAESIPRECDLVMKGGITSGVIYPRLVSELSKVYRLRSIGGTSAGAIAAAAAAAAQLGASAGTATDAFERLARLPKELGEGVPGTPGSKLLSLFQPRPELRRHFGVLVGALNAESKSGRVASILGATVLRFPAGAVLGAIPGIVLLATSYGVGRWVSGLVLLLGLVAGALIDALSSLFRELPRRGFGLCDGMSPEGKAPEALAPWLHGYLNGLAGKALAEPLTFGELWAGTLRVPGAPSPYRPGSPKSIELAMMTTALNLGRPFVLPFENHDLYFCEEELRTFLPKALSDWMVAHARPSKTAEQLSRAHFTIRALPLAEDLPVLFAVRLSLSFPILLSAVPLYGVDRTLAGNTPQATVPTRIYFSDGGICSNFPIHFFDAPLPSRPTFGANLRAFHPEHPKERVWLPETLKNNQGVRTYIPPLSDAPGLASVLGFLTSIGETMQNWGDQLQLVMPGFRDRIVHVSHTDKEGGLNLDMPKGVIEDLGQAGAEAAARLLGEFEEPGSEGWANHRRIRLRTLVAGVQEQLDALARALSKPNAPTWQAMARDQNPPSYPFSNARDQQGAEQLLDMLEQASKALAGAHLDDGAPRPRPAWRMTPRL